MTNLRSLSFSDIVNMRLLGDESFYECKTVDAEFERMDGEIERLRNKVAALTIVAYGTPENPKSPVEPECEHREINPIADTHASWCVTCGSFYDGSQWINPNQRFTPPAERQSELERLRKIVAQIGPDRLKAYEEDAGVAHEMSADAVDAARYRWMREHYFAFSYDGMTIPGVAHITKRVDPDLDAEIDRLHQMYPLPVKPPQ